MKHNIMEAWDTMGNDLSGEGTGLGSTSVLGNEEGTGLAIAQEGTGFYKTASLNEKLAKAKQYLGESYILHPNYKSELHPQHSLKDI